MKAYTALEDLEQDLGFPAKTLYGLSNNLDKHYRNAFIPKHDGSKRKLSVPDIILKKVQRSISDNILSKIPGQFKHFFSTLQPYLSRQMIRPLDKS